MTQAVIHTRVNLPSISTTAPTSSFSFYHVNTGTGSGTGSDHTFSALRTAVTNALTVTTISTHVFGYWMHHSLNPNTNGCFTEYTEISAHLDGSPAGSPNYIDHWTLGAAATSTLPCPESVAIVLGRNSDYGSDAEFGPGHSRPKQRDRNRCYIGPVNVQNFNEETTTNRCFIPASLVTAWLNWFKSLDDINGGIDTTWSLATWSQTNQSVRTATNLYMDDRPDTRRLRQIHQGIKTNMALP
jgi:hypothetical protein